MRERRHGRTRRPGRGPAPCDGAAGGRQLGVRPRRLCRAFSIDGALTGASLLGREVWLEQGRPVPDRAVRRTPRIGVDYAGAWARRLYRFVVAGDPAVSGPRRLR